MVRALITGPNRTIDWIDVPVERYGDFLAMRHEIGQRLAALDAALAQEERT
jgi:hypothetical protein